MSIPPSSDPAESSAAPASPKPVVLPAAVKPTLLPSQTVFYNYELRAMILKLLDRPSYVKMMRVELGVMKIVVDDIYECIAIQHTKGWKRKTNIGQIRCDAVTCLDCSPIPRTDSAIPEASLTSTRITRAPCMFDFEATSLYVGKLRETYPNLGKTSNNFPEIDGDDAYTVHINDQGKISSVWIERTIFIDVDKPNFRVPVFPTTPVYPGVSVQMHFALRLFKGDICCPTLAERDDLREEWRMWFYHGMERDRSLAAGTPVAWLPSVTPLDRRVIGIDQFSARVAKCTPSTIGSLINFIQQRRNVCEPLTQLFIDRGFHSIPLTSLNTLTTSLGPGLSVLHFTSLTFGAIVDLNSNLQKLDLAFPNLAVLKIGLMIGAGGSLGGLQPLSGFSNLRRLILDGLGPPSVLDSRPQFVCRAGNLDTVFQDTSLWALKVTAKYQKDVIAAKRLWMRTSLGGVNAVIMVKRGPVRR